MTLSLTHEVLRLRLGDAFRIARVEEAATTITTVVVEIRDPAHPHAVGMGEGFPEAYYGETPATMAAVFPILLTAIGELEPTTAGLARAASAMDAAMGGHGAAKCAIDVALHDLVGKVAGVPVHALLGLPAVSPPTDFTLGIDAPPVVAERARRRTDFPALKVKCGGPADVDTLRAVREVYAGPIRVDANTAWTREIAASLLPVLVDLGVELIEQPFPARSYRDLAWLQDRSKLPIVADESCVFPDDVDALAGIVAGVNVKLAKCGGIGPAHAMLVRARELGLRTFVGCMEESSLGIAASAVVAPLAEWVDLDGCLLLAEDPFEGLELDEGKRWHQSPGPGLGLTRLG